MEDVVTFYERLRAAASKLRPACVPRYGLCADALTSGRHSTGQLVVFGGSLDTYGGVAQAVRRARPSCALAVVNMRAAERSVRVEELAYGSTVHVVSGADVLQLLPTADDSFQEEESLDL